MVENNDEVAEQLRVRSHALVHGLQQPQHSALPSLKPLSLLQLWDGQAPAGITFRQVLAPGLGPSAAPLPASPAAPQAYLSRISSLAVRIRVRVLAGSSWEPCREALGSVTISSLPVQVLEPVLRALLMSSGMLLAGSSAPSPLWDGRLVTEAVGEPQHSWRTVAERLCAHECSGWGNPGSGPESIPGGVGPGSRLSHYGPYPPRVCARRIPCL